MRVVVFGAKGFLGTAVAAELGRTGHEVHTGEVGGERINLLDSVSIGTYLQHIEPEVVINCAGIVNPEDNFDNNILFTKNILESARHLQKDSIKVLVTGSAAEYGEVDSLPVSEATVLRGASPYAKSKIEEEKTALAYDGEHGMEVVVARVFNPLGRAMKGRFLIPGLLRQIRLYQQDRQDHIELSRLDSVRDYIDIDDVARAYRMIIEGSPEHSVYNIGSGIQTSNKEILDLLLRQIPLVKKPRIVETSDSSEPLIASQADITRIQHEFGWSAKISLDQTIGSIVDASE